MNLIDRYLNKITMYRLVVYGLCVIAGAGLLLALLGYLSLSPADLVITLAVLLISSYLTEIIFAKIWGVPANSESWLITGLILFLILQPANDVAGFAVAALAGVIAIASKYILAVRGKHIFNPAALAASVLSLSALAATTWWVGSSSLWPVLLLVGLAVVRKIRRFQLVFTFAAIALLLPFVLDGLAGRLSFDNLQGALLVSPLIFLSTIMLTEPATMPSRRLHQLIFAAGVAVLYAPGWHIGSLYIYPEVALVLGNIYAFAVSPKLKLRLRLKQINRVSEHVYDYVFTPEQQFSFKPGQYLEWTLPHVASDNRGNRRTFTIASSPTESDVHLGIKYYEPSSTFKNTFRALKSGDSIYASQLAGNFTLDGNESKPLVFIAGGIGITPFRSMIKYITDRRLKVDITLLYQVSDATELAYTKEFEAAAVSGVKYLPLISTRLDHDRLSQLVPDYARRIFYVSGPAAMVDSTAQILKSVGIPSDHIIRDHFSGY